MKKRRSTRSRARDLLVILLCLAGTTASLYLFWMDFNAVLSKTSELPIATVSWKYRAAQRKFSDRLIWDRLQQSSFVYNGDTIRTAEGAQTTVTFEDSQLELGENTIIQIQVDDGGTTSVSLDGGILSAVSGGGSNLQLRSGAITVVLEEGAALNATADGSSPLSLQMTAGNATVSGGGSSYNLAEGQGVSVAGDGQTTARAIAVTQPAPRLRMLKFEGDTVPIQFTWQTSDSPADAQTIFETAEDRNFTRIVEQIGLSGLQSMTMDLEEGIHYWRLYLAVDGVPLEDTVETGRVEILDAPPPAAIVPLDGDSFTYRTRLPTIRFMWEGNQYASSHLFEVADNPQMNDPIVSQSSQYPSSIVSILGAGTWYWRVTPYYTVGGLGWGTPSRVSSFTVRQLDQLDAPQPLSPAPGEMVKIAGGEDSRGPLFSWKREAEAHQYTVRLSRDESMSDIVATLTTGNNYTPALPPSTGRWYWDVSQTDSEGNRSGPSAVRSFLAVDREVEFQTIFPPDKYQIANTRIQDIKFTWKNNLEDSIAFQVSDSEDFATILHEAAYSPDIISGYSPRLAEGTYWWRLRSGDGSTNITTEPKEFQVVPQLPKAVTTNPVGGSTVIYRPQMYVTLRWNAVEGADYYQVLLYSAHGQEPIAQELFSEDTQMEVSFDNHSDGIYRWTIQAFANETPKSTRVTGLLSESFFSVKKIYPVSLSNPRPGAEYAGMDAYLNPDRIAFDSRSPVEDYQILIARDGYGPLLPKEHGAASPIPERELVYRGTARTLPPLGAGTYWWTVTATTEGGYDISNHTPQSFTVHPVEPFPPVQGMRPEDGSLFDEEYLVSTTDLELSWQAMPEAEAYQLVLTNTDTNEQVMDIVVPAVPDQQVMTYTLDLTQVGLANFTWTVRARLYMPTSKPRDWTADIILKDGQGASGNFEVALPADEILVHNTGDLYGN